MAEADFETRNLVLSIDDRSVRVAEERYLAFAYICRAVLVSSRRSRAFNELLVVRGVAQCDTPMLWMLVAEHTAFLRR